MNQLGKESKFFLGTNTPNGFFSKFSQLYCPNQYRNQYIIKAGAGCGKSTFMKKLAHLFQSQGHDVCVFPCSADPDSLDALACDSLSFSICDGTAPHVIEPDFPGAVEQVLSFYPALNNLPLKKQQEHLILHTKHNKEFHKRSATFLGALHTVSEDRTKLYLPHLKKEKLEKYTKNFISKIFKQKLKKDATEQVGFLSTITLNGVEFFHDTPFILSNHVYEIKDSSNLISHLFLSPIRESALAYGYDIITCYCPLSPMEKIEHLYIKELDLFLVTSNGYHRLKQKPAQTIHSTRFFDKDGVQKQKQKLNFNKKLSHSILQEIIQLQQQAKQSHDKMEEIYIPNVNFTEIDKIFENLLKECSL